MEENDIPTFYEVPFHGLKCRGFCNKLHILFSAIDIVIKSGLTLIEPEFGWETPILFSEIYDIRFFIESIKNLTGVNNILIQKNDLPENSKIIRNNIDLFGYNEHRLFTQRNNCEISHDEMSILVLKSLKINDNYNHIMSSYNIENKPAIHIRIESDWIKYSKMKICHDNELYVIDILKLIEMYKDSSLYESDVFITTGQNQIPILKNFIDDGINCHYYYNNNYEYEINAAINFELCVRAKIFIGISRSTYSNLITLKRTLIKKDESYIYNYCGKMLKRQDKGLYSEPFNSIYKSVKIINIDDV